MQIDVLKQKWLSMPENQREVRQVYAVLTGSPVQYSSCQNQIHTHYQLDYNYQSWHCWCPNVNQNHNGSWIQVSSCIPRLWTSVITQGRGDLDNWVKSIKISYTLNGKVWQYVQNGKEFQANGDRNTKVKIKLDNPIYARVVRIHPQSFQQYRAMRFDATYVDFE